MGQSIKDKRNNEQDKIKDEHQDRIRRTIRKKKKKVINKTDCKSRKKNSEKRV